MTNLSSKGMLINLSISQWAGRKHDKTVSQEVAAQHGTSSDAGRYNKSLVAKEALDTIKKAANKARTFHYENTLPWSNDGARILPARQKPGIPGSGTGFDRTPGKTRSSGFGSIPVYCLYPVRIYRTVGSIQEKNCAMGGEAKNDQGG